MLKDFSIQKKLILAFSILLSLFLIYASYSLYSLNKTLDGYKNYREMARDTVLASRVQANMLMLQVSVEKYLKEPKKDMIQEIEEYYEKTAYFVYLAKQEIKKKQRAPLVKKIDLNLYQYKYVFFEITKLYEIRDKIVKKDLDINGKWIENLLTSIMQSARKDKDLAGALSAGEALRTLLLARLYTHKYLVSNKQDYAKRVYKEFTLLKDDFKKLENEIQNTKRREQLELSLRLISQYQRGVKTIVEIIEKRNFLIENKLHKLGLHIQDLAENVKLSVKQDQDKIGPKLLEIFLNVKSILFFMSIVVLLITFFILFYTSKQVILPLKSLDKAIENLINSKGIYTKLSVKSNDEISTVCKTFNLYLEQKDDIIKSREELLRNISHELKTPVSKGKFILEKMRQKALSPDENIKELDSIFSEINRLLTLLLEMEKLKYMQLPKTSVPITTIVFDALSKLYIEDDSKIDIQIEKEFEISVNQAYMVLAVKNLLDNALKYAQSYPVEIKIMQNKSLQIINNGEKLSKPFSFYLQPFNRDIKSSFHRGHGLGLSFISLIMKSHNFELLYHFEEQKNHFTLEFTD